VHHPGGDQDEEVDLPIVYRLAKRQYTARQLFWMDVVAVILLGLIVQFLLPKDVPRVHGTMWHVIGGIGYIAAALGTLLRRRFPWPTLAFIIALSTFAECLRASGPTGFFMVMALYSVVAVSSRRAAAIVVGVDAVATLTATIVAGGGSAAVVPTAIGGLALIGVGWLAGENTRASRIYASHRAEREAERVAALEADRDEQVRRAVADERVEIARELHDIVAHAMSVIAVRSGVARMVLDTQPEQAREALGIIETTTRRSLQEMRLLVGVLRDAGDHPAELGPAPGMSDIDRLLADIALAGVSVDVEIEGQPRALPPAASLSAFRIVQEALTNVVRHAGPTHARLQFTFHADEVDIEVVDDGPDPAAHRDPALARQGTGHGLIGMRERAALFGGSLEAGPCGAGFRVRADLHTDDLHTTEPAAQVVR
jgi:signal transduction histidine kinase